jgi:NAD(P)-dependent dehydrogenase (short-subunit alcohol dehydrogenase family)
MPKTAIITGGTKGLGRAMALRLAPENWNLVLNYRSDDASAREMLDACTAACNGIPQRADGATLLVKGDVSQRPDVEALVQTAIQAFGAVDVLINNAGLNVDKPLHDLTDEDWDRVVDTSMKGTFLCSQIASRHMLQQEAGGVILNVGASTGISGRKNGINYCAAKAGVMTMTKCLALELAPRIRVNCILPGMVRTKEIEERFKLDDPECLAAVERAIPLNRLGDPEEVAAAVSFLVSDDARYITGQKLILDGGRFMF